MQIAPTWHQFRLSEGTIRIGSNCFFYFLYLHLLDGFYRYCMALMRYGFNTLRPRQNGRHLPDDIFKCIFMNENVRIATNISLKFVPKGLINNIPALVLIMAWRRLCDKPLSEPMMVSLPTHICVTQVLYFWNYTIIMAVRLRFLTR